MLYAREVKFKCVSIKLLDELNVYLYFSIELSMAILKIVVINSPTQWFMCVVAWVVVFNAPFIFTHK